MKIKATRQNKSEGFYQGLFFLTASISVLAVGLITVMIFYNAWPALREIGLWDLLSGNKWTPTASNPLFGLLPMIVGSMVITLLALVIGLPIGIATSIFLAELAKGKFAAVLRRSVEMLAAVPSVVYGFVGLTLVVPFVQKLGGTGLSILSAGIILGVMILPTMISVYEVSLRAVPAEFKEGSLALGASHWQTIGRVLIPASRSGLLTAIALSIGRAVGETMAVILVAGNIPKIPDSILDPARTLTVNIIMEMGYVEPGSLHYSALFATGAILFVFIMFINLGVQFITRKAVKK